MAEREGRSGPDLLAGVTLGYDVCCRFLMALGPDLVRGSHRSAEGTSSTMGATAAAASLAGLDEKSMRFALSYGAQQVSGIWSWVRDDGHVEKAFDFSGMGARNGVTAAIMAQMGFSGVRDVFDGEHRHQALLGRLSHTGSSGCVPHAPSRTQAECRQRGADCREAPGGWRPHRQ
jgi:2-methylcitrate dehydratase PrpD